MVVIPSVQANALNAIVFAAAALDGPTPAVSPYSVSAFPLATPAASPLSLPTVSPYSLPPPPMYMPYPLDRPVSTFDLGTPASAVEVSAVADGVRVGPAQTLVSYELAFKSVAESNKELLTSLEIMYEQTRRQGRGWYRMSILAAGIGLCIVAAAVVALVLGHVTAGIVMTVSSVIPSAVAGMFFGQSKRADDRVDAVTVQLTELREWGARLQIVQLITDPHLQNELKAEMVRNMIPAT